ncbi:MAG: L-histidine N(alpha)-methyltransferase [Rhodospirillales bacterium]|nr:MAG: L-histidine N(alpha)-methyltransferase [Rhodospirillales bacterium]
MNLSVHAMETVADEDHAEFERAVLAGLGAAPRAIPAKFLYDARGSALFDAICDLPEYYLTRSEAAILRTAAPEIAALAASTRTLVEFGSGSSVKTRLLLDALRGLRGYAPIDVSREHLDTSAQRLRRDYPRLVVDPICADYMALESLARIARPALGFFPGSTIGNLTPEEARSFLRRARRLLGDDGALVVGVDTKKDTAALHAAYNDSAGVTAAFTLNLLRRMNRELDANFDLSAFSHEASYDAARGRIEIYFRSRRPQTVTVAGRTFTFAEGERVHTEYSYKYGAAEFEALVDGTGFEPWRTWTDPDRLFAVHHLVSIRS